MEIERERTNEDKEIYTIRGGLVGGRGEYNLIKCAPVFAKRPVKLIGCNR
jgi:hypothetical protein